MIHAARYPTHSASLNRRVRPLLSLIFLWTLGFAFTAIEAQPAQRPGGGTSGGKGWFSQFSGGYLHQLKSDLNSGGEFGGDRYVAQASIGYRKSYTKQVALGIGYVRDNYRFEGPGIFNGPSAWDDVQTLSFAAPVRWGLDDRWMLFVLPSIRVMAEESADWGDAITGGGIAGASFKVNERLTLGPGIGALSQIEDSMSVFPVLLIDWKINDRLRLETGRGLGASQGPGLLLSYELDRDWSLLLGGRYERLRFRLSETGAVADGVGEDRGAPVFIGLRHSLGSRGEVSVFTGIDLGGKLQVDNRSGDELFSSGYDPAPFVGLSARLRF